MTATANTQSKANAVRLRDSDIPPLFYTAAPDAASSSAFIFNRMAGARSFLTVCAETWPPVVPPITDLRPARAISFGAMHHRRIVLRVPQARGERSESRARFFGVSLSRRWQSLSVKASDACVRFTFEFRGPRGSARVVVAVTPGTLDVQAPIDGSGDVVSLALRIDTQHQVMKALQTIAMHCDNAAASTAVVPSASQE